MAVVKARASWTGPQHDVLLLSAEDPYVGPWTVDPVDGWGDFVVLREVDQDDELTGRVAGVEVVDFLLFDRWDIVPELPVLWQVNGWEPLPLAELLRRLQAEYRKQAKAGVA